MADTIAVTLPAALLSLFPGAPRQVFATASSIATLLDELDRNWPGMRDRLRDSSPQIRRHIKIIVGEELAHLHTVLRPGDQVHILTAVSGG